MNSEVGHSLNDYLWGKCAIKDCAHDVTGHLGTQVRGQVFLIPSSIKAGEIARILREGYDVGLLNDGFRDVVTELGLDYLLIDTASGSERRDAAFDRDLGRVSGHHAPGPTGLSRHGGYSGCGTQARCSQDADGRQQGASGFRS